MNRAPAFRHNEMHLELDSFDCLIWIMKHDFEEVGRTFTEMAQACRSRDVEALRKFGFIERIYRGHAGRPPISPPIRRRVLSAGRCLFCGSTERLEVDHIKPVSKGGTNDLRNLQCLCAPCNRKKGPERGGLV